MELLGEQSRIGAGFSNNFTSDQIHLSLVLRRKGNTSHSLTCMNLRLHLHEFQIIQTVVHGDSEEHGETSGDNGFIGV